MSSSMVVGSGGAVIGAHEQWELFHAGTADLLDLGDDRRCGLFLHEGGGWDAGASGCKIGSGFSAVQGVGFEAEDFTAEGGTQLSNSSYRS